MMDPVCGKEVEQGKYMVSYKKRRYYFCGITCETMFKRKPDEFAASSPGAHENAGAKLH